MFFYILKF